MKTTIHVDRDQIQSTVAEEQYNFVRYVLGAIGLEIDTVLPENYTNFQVDHKIKLRQLLHTFQVSIVGARDGGLKIYVQQEVNNSVRQELIAEWKSCRVSWKLDQVKTQPSEKVYAALELEWWSMFDTPTE